MLLWCSPTTPATSITGGLAEAPKPAHEEQGPEITGQLTRKRIPRPNDVRSLEPLATQTLTDAELQRAVNLGKNGPRNVDGIVMTHCVPAKRIDMTGSGLLFVVRMPLSHENLERKRHSHNVKRSSPVAVDRLLPTAEAEDLIALTRAIADKELTPRVNEHERDERFPEGLFGTLGAAGLLGLPYPEEQGGSGQPYVVYLQVLEELAVCWAAVAVAVSVHGLSCFPLATYGTAAQQQKWLPDMLGGGLLGAYSLSEPQAGSDAAALSCKARRTDDGYRINGAKAWVTSGGKADFYTLFARTGEGSRGISCFLVPGDTPGLSFGKPEEKMGLRGVPTAAASYDDAVVDVDRLIGAEGEGLRIAFSALDSGRLGIAAIAVGLAQGALDDAVAYAKQRRTFGKAIIDHQGLGFLLADMAAAVDSARATYLDAARRRDLGRPYSRQASVAKLIATDAAMKVTTDAVQVLGGYGYVRDFPLERYMREAKVMQIFEGTNQIQRLVISRQLAAS